MSFVSLHPPRLLAQSSHSTGILLIFVDDDTGDFFLSDIQNTGEIFCQPLDIIDFYLYI